MKLDIGRIWDLMTAGAAVNPLLIILAATVAFGIVTFANKNRGEITLLVVLVYTATAMFLPAGQQVLVQANTLPRIQDKVICAGAATVELAMWHKDGVKQVKQCAYRDRSLKIKPASSAGEKALNRTRNSLVSKFGVVAN